MLLILCDLPSTLYRLFNIRELSRATVRTSPVTKLNTLIKDLYHRNRSKSNNNIKPIRNTSNPKHLRTVRRQRRRVRRSNLVPTQHANNGTLRNLPTIPNLIRHYTLANRLRLNRLRISIIILRRRSIRPIRPPIINKLKLKLYNNILIRRRKRLRNRNDPLPQLTLNESTTTRLTSRLLSSKRPRTNAPMLNTNINKLLNGKLRRLILRRVPTRTSTNIHSTRLMPRNNTITK